jgi:hypothetical protein
MYIHFADVEVKVEDIFGRAAQTLSVERRSSVDPSNERRSSVVRRQSTDSNRAFLDVIRSGWSQKKQSPVRSLRILPGYFQLLWNTGIYSCIVRKLDMDFMFC